MEGKIDYIMGGCVCGGFLALGFEKQVHIFQTQAPMKRVGIYVADSDIKKIINLNDVNVVGVVLWDLSFVVLSLSESQPRVVKAEETAKWEMLPNLGYIHSSELTINTQKFICTLLCGYLVLCSSDSLHLYQPEKTVINVYELPARVFGREIYPVLDLNESPQPGTLLMKGRLENRDEADSYRLVRISSKYLVKDMGDLKVEISEIVGFPEAVD